ncbi:MAG: division/cell wall cluster transcriptional repressor MraZ [Chitinophagaceae bacterium]|nr:division/cell wall cluster transcriptional repressor MraZ [Chitinophagaceae bacterium]
MANFIGEYELTIDAKGRFLLPASFRKQLPEGADVQFVVSRGFDNCLNLYPMEAWQALTEKITKLNEFNSKVRDFTRVFLNGSNIVESDAAGRLLLTKSLLEHAGISKDIIFTAQGNKMEIWDRATHKAYIQSKMADFSDLANEVLGGGFMSPFENLG